MPTLVTMLRDVNGATGLACGIMPTFDDIVLEETGMAETEKEAYLGSENEKGTGIVRPSKSASTRGIGWLFAL